MAVYANRDLSRKVVPAQVPARRNKPLLAAKTMTIQGSAAGGAIRANVPFPLSDEAP